MSATVGNIYGSRFPCASSPSDGPPGGSCDKDDGDTESVLQPGGRALSLFENVGEAVAALSTASGTSATGSTTASSATRQSKVLLLGKKRSVLVGYGVLGSSDRALTFATGIEGVIIEALRQQDGVGEAEVDSEGDNSGHEISPESTGEVGDVAGHPY